MATPPALGGLIQDRMAPQSQADLARKMGVSRMAVSDLIANKCRVTARMAVRLSRCLGSTPAWWMDRQRDIDLHRLK